MTYILYECGICDAYHPWEWDGDCRDDENRTYPDEYARNVGVDECEIEVLTMEDRLSPEYL